jgi:hypothetical protein
VARGGKTSGAGRPKRARVRKSPKAASSGETQAPPSPAAGVNSGVPTTDGLLPVDIIIGMMRGDLPFDDARFKAAVAAAPYVHARRGTAEAEEEPAPRHEDALKELE